MGEPEWKARTQLKCYHREEEEKHGYEVDRIHRYLSAIDGGYKDRILTKVWMKSVRFSLNFSHGHQLLNSFFSS